MNTEILLPEAYLSFPSLGKPKPDGFDSTKAPRFLATFIFPKGTDMTKLNGIIEYLKGEMSKPLMHCKLKKCADKIDRDTGLVQGLYDQGDYYLEAWSSENKPPKLLGPSADPEENYFAANFKGGNLVQGYVKMWQSCKVNGCIGAELMCVQWRGEGKPFGIGTEPKPKNFDMFTSAVQTMDAASLGI